jgi:hypothetical protein
MRAQWIPEKKSNPAKNNNHVVLTNPTKRSFLIRCRKQIHNPHAPTMIEWPVARSQQFVSKKRNETPLKDNTGA